MRCGWMALAGVVTACAGCDLGFRADSNGAGGRQSPLVQVQTANEVATQSQQAAPATQPEAQPGTAPAADGTKPSLKPAEVGVGVKGQGYGGGLITEPIRTRFRAEEQIDFLQVKQALQFFEATEGRAPKSHEEFMQRIIQANSIQLPELPPGQSYVYDPQTKELMIDTTK